MPNIAVSSMAVEGEARYDHRAMPEPPTRTGGDRKSFPPTSWTLIRRARGEGEDARAHMDRLIATYWKPVYWHVRTRWHKTNEDAKDLTQEFFTTIVLGREALASMRDEGARFRSFLRACLENFLLAKNRDGARLKRGGGAVTISLEGDVPAISVAEGASSDEAFDAAWAQTVLADALEALARLYRTTGRGDYWDVFERYDLRERSPTYEECAAELGLKRDDVHNRLRHARRTLRELVCARLRETLEDPGDLASELTHLSSLVKRLDRGSS